MRQLLVKYLKNRASDQQIEWLLDYILELLKWNKVYNLTAITDPKEVVIKHIIDSLSISYHISGKRILDVGTGAGLPGIPLAIMFPEKHFTLLDSNSKKTRFLLNVVGKLCLHNVSIIQHRIETYCPEKCHDIIVSRAFSQISDFLEKTRHLICPDGIFLAMKGVYPKEELEQLPQGFRLQEVIELKVPDLEAKRHLIKIKN